MNPLTIKEYNNKKIIERGVGGRGSKISKLCVTLSRTKIIMTLKDGRECLKSKG